MSRFTTSHWRVPVASLIALGAIAAPASAANVKQTEAKVAKLVDKAGGPIAGLTGGCDVQSADQVFAPWGDLAYYTLAPQGDFEAATRPGRSARAPLSWPRTRRSARGAHALSLGANGTAVTPPFCVDVTQPTMRFFTRNAGSAADVSIDALFTDPTGKAKSLPIAKLTPGAAWAPSDIALLYVNALAAVSPTGTTTIQLRFTRERQGWLDPSRRRRDRSVPPPLNPASSAGRAPSQVGGVPGR